ncbi:conserved hypothetical protein [Ricinus communis]|uniref:Uncharacterized protein n=1 Tax=Ricinus communis TaxID=3988 RepID=B9RMK9_RICCO|nr:conserved hypothetical protein [Ricinus communis]
MGAKDEECYGIVSRMRDAIRNVNADFVKNLQKSDDHLNFLKERAIKVEKGEEEDMVKFEVDMELLEHVSSTSNRNHPFVFQSLESDSYSKL